MADIKQYVKAAEEKMTFAIEYLDEQLSHIRAGKANPKILDCVRVMYYGAPVPLANVATVPMTVISRWGNLSRMDVQFAASSASIICCRVA